ncbi:hypothetical protein LCGC14_1452270 [marine sediment metagenome]|uniref:C2H2-type domain-containing protein n=1 Tax=marine sediment metagenome TaxID=412755 RepID=A0A0F9JIB3_9ZZZZ
MLRYLILAGGFWKKSKELLDGKQVDIENTSVVMSDYIIAVKGLPDDMFKPEEVRRYKHFHCETCDRPVSESEMEQKYGCFAHKLKFTERVVDIWRTDVFEAYNPKRVRWINPGFRIWVNNEQGIDKMRHLWRYIKDRYPSNKVLPSPIPVGNLRDWMIDLEDVPVIDLTIEEKEKVAQDAPSVVKVFGCMHYGCDREFGTRQGLFNHLNEDHPKIEKQETQPKKRGRKPKVTVPESSFDNSSSSG